MNHSQINQLIEQAVSGDKHALETVLTQVQDLVFNLSLRMLGTIPDAEDASQEILLKVMTHLGSFRKESAFSTWVFRIACNHLQDYKKHLFANAPMSFEFYGEDILSPAAKDLEDQSQGVDRALLSQELKHSCTNVMLQCLDPQSRIIFILGTMFKVDSRTAGEILYLSAEAYRQRLSRIRKKVGDFLAAYCGLSGTGVCQCGKRVDYAVKTHRLTPRNLEYSVLDESTEPVLDFTEAMEQVDQLSLVFQSMPRYQSTQKAKAFLTSFLSSDCCHVIRSEGGLANES